MPEEKSLGRLTAEATGYSWAPLSERQRQRWEEIAATLIKAYEERKKASDGLVCPFCREPDFDHKGLKMHYVNGWCEEYANA